MEMFSEFSDETLTRISCSLNSEIAHYPKNQIIHLHNEICYSADIILSGKVTVQLIDKNGNILTINTFRQKDVIGPNLMFSERNFYPMTVIAESECTIFHMKKELILELAHINDNFLIQFMKIISDNTFILTDKINAISMKSIRQAIIDYLNSEYGRQNSLIIQLDMTKKELAEKLGIPRTSLSRELSKMKKDGLLEFDASTITIKSDDLFS